jgi:SAM-dependent methyltransferase
MPVTVGRWTRELEHGRTLAQGDPVLIWGWGTPAGQRRARRRARLIARAAGLRPGMDVLEIGCGSGLFTEMFAAAGARIVAVDVSPDLLAQARLRGLPASQVRWICGRVEDLRGSGRFDAVIGSSVLHHLELDDALATIFRLLKDGGVASFAEPNMLNPQVWLERHPGPFRAHFAHVSPDETAFVRWRLARSFLAHGFSAPAIEPFDWLHPATPAALIPAVERIGRVLEAVPGAREIAGSLHIVASRPRRTARG